MYLFVDTTQFDSAGKNIFHHDFVRVQAFAEHGLLRLVVPEITSREWHGHLDAHASQLEQSASSALNRLKKLAGKAVEDEQACIAALVSTAKTCLERFLSGASVISISSADADLAGVVDDYFAGRAPFGAGKKKHEFPDALVVSSLVRFARENEVQIVIVSEDGDFAKAAERYPSELRMVQSLPECLGEAWKASDEATGSDAVSSAFENNMPSLLTLDSVRSELVDVELGVDFDEYYDAEIEDIAIEELLDASLFVVGVNKQDELVDVSGVLQIRVSATIYSKDPEYMYRDSDTRDFMYLANLYTSITAVVETDLEGCLELDALLKGESEWEDLSIATSGLLDVRGFEITAQRSSADEPEWHGEDE